MKLIAPFGFYGWGNIGDESTLQGFAKLWQQVPGGAPSWIGARDTQHCRRAEPMFRYFPAAATRSLRRRWAWETADAMVVPGGTPIMDVLGDWPLSEVVPLVTRARSMGKPIAFIGTGTEELRKARSRRLVAEVLSPAVCTWTVRATADRERLVEYGVDPESVSTAADLAWGLNPVSREFGARCFESLGIEPGLDPIIGVCVNIERFVRTQQPRLLAEIAAALDSMIDQRSARVVFLCNETRDGETFDLAASREVMSLMHRQERALIVPNSYWLPQEMMSMVACCDVVLGTRYHFCLFAALQSVPFVAIERSSKVRDLCHDLTWRHSVPLASLSAEALCSAFDAVQQNRESAAEQLQGSVLALRRRCGRNELALSALRDRVH